MKREELRSLLLQSMIGDVVHMASLCAQSADEGLWDMMKREFVMLVEATERFGKEMVRIRA